MKPLCGTRNKARKQVGDLFEYHGLSWPKKQAKSMKHAHRQSLINVKSEKEEKMDKSISTFLKPKNSAYAHKMAEDAVMIEAWPVAEPGDEHTGEPMLIKSAKSFASKKLQNTWVRLRFYFDNGQTCQEEFYNA
jgi:hypothetical protein